MKCGYFGPPKSRDLVPFDCGLCKLAVSASRVVVVSRDLIACPFCGAVYARAVVGGK